MEEKPQEPDFYPPAEDYGITSPGKNSRESAAWFYTQGGNRQGPVPFSQIRELAGAASLNPRHDMVWTKGMSDWIPSGEVDGLFERVLPPAPLQKEVEEDPYVPPEELMDGGEFRQTVWPGSNRRTYLFMTLVFPMLFSCGLALATPFLTQQLGITLTNQITMVAVWIPLVLALFVILGRFANLGMSRWWFLGNFVPFLNIWLGYRCFACPAGYAQTKKLDGAGIFLAILYWLLLAIGILAIAGFILFLAKAGDHPDLQQRAQEFYQEAIKHLPSQP